MTQVRLLMIYVILLRLILDAELSLNFTPISRIIADLWEFLPIALPTYEQFQLMHGFRMLIKMKGHGWFGIDELGQVLVNFRERWSTGNGPLIWCIGTCLTWWSC